MSNKQTKVLFVCMGNICRSPVAECLFRSCVEEKGCGDSFHIDSAGTGGWHVGAKPDRRMRSAAKQRGLAIDGSARQITANDFSQFDWIFCMDQDNLDEVISMGASPDNTKLLLRYTEHPEEVEVPDPYYGGDDGFDDVITLIHDAVQKLANMLA